jgi:hypothetical protein
MKQDSTINIARSAVRQYVRGVLRRILDGADGERCRDIERVIGRSNGYLTDEVERRVAQHLMRNSSFLAKRHSARANEGLFHGRKHNRVGR